MVDEEKETVTIWARITKRERRVIEGIARKEDRSLAYVVSRLLRERLAMGEEVDAPQHS